MAKVATRIVLDKKTLKKALRELSDIDPDIARAAFNQAALRA